jgi:ATP-binding cassette, subfamily B, multidrug efflux pump
MKHLFAFASFVRPYWRRAAMSLLLLTTLVFMDLSIPRLTQRIIDQGIRRQDQQVVIQTGLLMLAISLLGTLFAVGNNVLSVRVGESVARDLRNAIFGRIQSFSPGNLDRLNTGQLMTRLTSDTAALQRLTQISLRIGTRAPLLMIGSLILMIRTSPSLALTMLPLLIVTSAIIVFFVPKMEPIFRSVQKNLDRLNTVLQENLSGVRLVRAFVRADFEEKRFEAANSAFAGESVRVMKFMAGMSPLLTMCVNIGMVVVIWAGGLDAIRGDLTLGQVVAFTNYLLTTMTPLIMMTNLSNVWANGIASSRRIGEVLNEVPEVRDEPGALALPAGSPGRIAFEKVSFRYGGSEEPVLEGIDLEIEPGTTVAFLGATGAGKTTLINLIPRFYDVTGGRILFDGHDIRRIRLASLQHLVAVVPQETVLFSGSVRDNIRYGVPDAGEEEVVSAARAAQAHEFILELPSGYDTHVEERGVNLSGGQKQRIAIARALIAHPGVLILDDSTSSVDVETETRIQTALEERRKGCTTLVVAQRISTVLEADRIVVIDEGRIAAEGTHQQLMASSGIYREIYESQLGDGPAGGAPEGTPGAAS